MGFSARCDIASSDGFVGLLEVVFEIPRLHV